VTVGVADEVDGAFLCGSSPSLAPVSLLDVLFVVLPRAFLKGPGTYSLFAPRRSVKSYSAEDTLGARYLVDRLERDPLRRQSSGPESAEYAGRSKVRFLAISTSSGLYGAASPCWTRYVLCSLFVLSPFVSFCAFFFLFVDVPRAGKCSSDEISGCFRGAVRDRTVDRALDGIRRARNGTAFAITLEGALCAETTVFRADFLFSQIVAGGEGASTVSGGEETGSAVVDGVPSFDGSMVSVGFVDSASLAASGSLRRRRADRGARFCGDTITNVESIGVIGFGMVLVVVLVLVLVVVMVLV